MLLLFDICPHVHLYNVGFLLQCIAAVPREAQKISPELCEAVQEVCFQELLWFVKR